MYYRNGRSVGNGEDMDYRQTPYPPDRVDPGFLLDSGPHCERTRT